mmetsp:Transcript_77235/g.239232  ORF Transcript_77235/g.239232 Transcript_77235/m.239232 type:complete len:286 (+) Transcript_77235:213-1070(+)
MDLSWAGYHPVASWLERNHAAVERWGARFQGCLASGRPSATARRDLSRSARRTQGTSEGPEVLGLVRFLHNLAPALLRRQLHRWSAAPEQAGLLLLPPASELALDLAPRQRQERDGAQHRCQALRQTAAPALEPLEGVESLVYLVRIHFVKDLLHFLGVCVLQHLHQPRAVAADRLQRPPQVLACGQVLRHPDGLDGVLPDAWVLERLHGRAHHLVGAHVPERALQLPGVEALEELGRGGPGAQQQRQGGRHAEADPRAHRHHPGSSLHPWRPREERPPVPGSAP